MPSGACPAQGYTPTLTLYVRALCSQKGAHLQHFKGHMKLDRYLGIYGVIGAQVMTELLLRCDAEANRR